MKSFQAAVRLGCQMVECDVRLSADGVLVLSHDPAVTDRSGARHIVAERTAAELAALDLGADQGAPTLAELVAWAAGRCAVMADMKIEGGEVEAKVAEALRALPARHKLVPGAGKASRHRLRAADPELPLSLSLDEEGMEALGGFEAVLAGLDTGAVTWRWPVITAERVQALHDRGVRVFAWTVDDSETMRRMASIGADGIISNRADLLGSLHAS